MDGWIEDERKRGNIGRQVEKNKMNLIQQIDIKRGLKGKEQKERGRREKVRRSGGETRRRDIGVKKDLSQIL